MNRKTMWTKVFCMVVAVMVFGALNAGAQTVLKFSHTDQQQGARQAAALFFGKKVEEYTNGRYKVQVFCCSQIGNDPKNIEQLALGGIDFTVSSTGSYAPHVDTLNLTMLPFLVETYDQGWKLYDESKWLQAQFDKAPAKGFRFLSTFEAGFRCMTTREPLSTPGRRQGQEAAHLPERDDALDARGHRLQRPDHAAARSVHGDPAGGRQRPGKPDRHHLLQQVLRSGART